MKARWQAGDLGIWLALLLPWSTKLPLATSEPGRAYVETPLILLLVGVLGILSLWVLERDRWLGAWCGWWTLHLLWTPGPLPYETVEMMVFGAVLLVMLRETDTAKWPWVIGALLTSALLQVGWLVMQTFSGYDVTWDGLRTFGSIGTTTHPAATMGNSKYLAAYLAMLTPLAPWPVLGLLLIGLMITHSLAGLLAAAVGIIVRFRTWTAGCVAAGLMGLAIWLHPALIASWATRWDYLTAGLGSLVPGEWLIGRGPSAWMQTVALLPVSHPTAVEGYPVWMHNDVAQVVYEGGLVALGLLAGWCWTQRHCWRTRWAGSCAAVAVLSVAMMPFHLVPMGMVALVVLAGATTLQKESGS